MQVGAIFNIPEKPKPGRRGTFFIGSRDGLILLMIRRNTRSNQAVGRRQPVKQVDLDHKVGLLE